MKDTHVPVELTVVCDEAEYKLTRREDTVGGPVWVIQLQGSYIVTFDAVDGETEDLVRQAACGVVRNGSTSFFPFPPRSRRN
jgi:hypothetical protein